MGRSLGTATHQGGGELPEPGVYRAKLIKIADVMSTWNDEEREQWKLTWKILAHADGETIEGPDEIGQWVNRTLHVKSTAYAIVRAIFGRDLEEGEDVDEEDLLEKPVQIVVVEYLKKSGGTGIKVDAVAPLRRSKAPQPAQREPVGAVASKKLGPAEGVDPNDLPF